MTGPTITWWGPFVGFLIGRSRRRVSPFIAVVKKASSQLRCRVCADISPEANNRK